MAAAHNMAAVHNMACCSHEFAVAMLLTYDLHTKKLVKKFQHGGEGTPDAPPPDEELLEVDGCCGSHFSLVVW